MALVLAVPLAATAQDASLSEPVTQSMTSGGGVYTPVDFSRFTSRNALDMLERVPGFVVTSNDQGRGLGQAGTNVLINGQRISSKSQDVFDQLRRVTAEQVDRIEIVDGATLHLPGLSGQVANPAAPPPGCYFHPRCHKVLDICRAEYPLMFNVGQDGYAACWLLQKGEA